MTFANIFITLKNRCLTTYFKIWNSLCL